jgi:hypothetical protein
MVDLQENIEETRRILFVLLSHDPITTPRVRRRFSLITKSAIDAISAVLERRCILRVSGCGDR